MYIIMFYNHFFSEVQFKTEEKIYIQKRYLVTKSERQKYAV